jgi:MSHA biogenesis protein MshO
LYSLANPGTISSGLVSQLSAGTTLNALTLELSAAHQFLTDSPTRRLFIVRPPEMFCFVGEFLNYYSGYGFQSSIPDPTSLTPAVVASQLSNGSFVYTPGTPSRAGVVTLSFDVVDAGGAMQSIAQEVQVRNVP